MTRRIDPVVAELARIRRRRGLCRRDVARSVGLKPATIGLCERGVTQPMLPTLRLWCTALGVDLAVLDEMVAERFAPNRAAVD